MSNSRTPLRTRRTVRRWTQGELQALYETTASNQPRSPGVDTAQTRALLAASLGAHLS